MATSTIWSHPGTQGNPLSDPRAMSGSGSSSSGTTDPNATISANDFLTLLVTEMQNQDPTNATDPNEYINQLVSVNSLEQLIQINQTLSGAIPQQGTGTGGTGSPGTVGGMSPGGAIPQAAPSGFTPMPGADGQSSPSARQNVTGGNLGVPVSVNPAASRVARALSTPGLS